MPCSEILKTSLFKKYNLQSSLEKKKKRVIFTQKIEVQWPLLKEEALK